MCLPDVNYLIQYNVNLSFNYYFLQVTYCINFNTNLYFSFLFAVQEEKEVNIQQKRAKSKTTEEMSKCIHQK